MNNNILNTFFNCRGSISRNNYLLGISSVLIFFIGIFSNFSYYIVKTVSTDVQDFYISISSTIVFQPLKQALLLPMFYLLYVVSYKRSLTIGLSIKQAKIYGLITLAGFWGLEFLFSHSQLWREPSWHIQLLISACLLIVAVYVVVKLYKGVSAIDTDLANTAFKLLLLSALAAIVALKFPYDIFAAPSPYPQAEEMYGVLGGFDNIISKYRTFADQAKAIGITIYFIALCCILMLNNQQKSFKILTLFAVFCIIELMATVIFKQHGGLLADLNEIIFAIMLSVTVLAQGQFGSQASPTVSLFKNNLLNTLFDYRGTLNTYDYRGGMVFIFLCLNMCIVSSLYVNRLLYADGPKYLMGLAKLCISFYFFVIIYSTVIVSIKRARSHRPSLAKTIILTTLVTLMIWTVLFMSSRIVPLMITRYCIAGDLFIPDYVYVMLGLIIAGILAVFYLARNDHHQSYPHKGSSLWLLLKYFKAYCIMPALMLILIGLQLIGIPVYTFMIYLKYIILSAFILYVITLYWRRATDAHISKGWIVAALISFAALAISFIYYLFDDSAQIWMLMISYLVWLFIFGQFLLILAPSYQKPQRHMAAPVTEA